MFDTPGRRRKRRGGGQQDPLARMRNLGPISASRLRVVGIDSPEELKRVGVVSGASIYPFAWNVLMAARHEGFGGTITTLAVAQEAKIQELPGQEDFDLFTRYARRYDIRTAPKSWFGSTYAPVDQVAE